MKQINTVKLALVVCTLALVAGCGQKEEPAPVAKSPKPQVKAPAPAEAAPAPGAPPEPSAAPGAQTVASTPVGSTPEGDPLFYFRRGDNGAIRNDLEALELAVESYSRNTGIRADLPSLKGKDLSVLVQTGFLKALPAPPVGKRYVLDQKTFKVSLQ